jgi:hypothetical protein
LTTYSKAHRELIRKAEGGSEEAQIELKLLREQAAEKERRRRKARFSKATEGDPTSVRQLDQDAQRKAFLYSQLPKWAKDDFAAHKKDERKKIFTLATSGDKRAAQRLEEAAKNKKDKRKKTIEDALVIK